MQEERPEKYVGAGLCVFMSLSVNDAEHPFGAICFLW